MKRIIMLALVLTTIITSAFANLNDAVNQKVLNSFSKRFATAENVKWELRKDLYRAEFTYQGQVLFAYYNESGEQVALSRNIRRSQMPLELGTQLQTYFEHGWLTELFEVTVNGETAYYATIENATHKIVLKANGLINWTTFKKEKK